MHKMFTRDNSECALPIQQKSFEVVCHGIDLGQVNDYTAYAVTHTTGGQTYLKYVNRWRLDSYKNMMATIADKINKKNGVVLGDASGAASPAAFEFLTPAIQKSSFIPVKITGGDEIHYNHGFLCVPNGHLIDNLKIGIQNGDLKLPSKLMVGDDDLLPILRKELQGYSAVKSDAGNWRFKSLTEHDDLLFAVALAYYGKTLAINQTVTKNGYGYRVY